MTVWLVIIGIGVVTFAIRLDDRAVGAHGRLTLVQASIALSHLRCRDHPARFGGPAGTLDLSWGNARLVAGAGAVVAWRAERTVEHAGRPPDLTIAQGLTKGG
jgi:hypothetical protein